ncbi:SRPBCC domain-containing protein [Mycoplasmatota bacterium]|nr:SRPBCC domain-containing protein [Mycoplasmatota bacterium]
MVKMIIDKKILLPTSKDIVWKALFDNEYVKKYMGCMLRKKDDNHLEWYKTIHDFDQVLLYGEIIENKTNEILKIKTFNPHRHYHSKFQLEVSYKLTEIKNKTELRIIQSGFEKLPDGKTVFVENKMGWDHSLSAFKEMIEKENN